MGTARPVCHSWDANNRPIIREGMNDLVISRRTLVDRSAVDTYVKLNHVVEKSL